MAIRVLLDTNAIISLFKENISVVSEVDIADEVFISIINELEFKSFLNLSSHDKTLFDDFASMVNILDLQASNIALKNKIIEIRNKYRLKLPDAIIAASAIVHEALLVNYEKEKDAWINDEMKILQRDFLPQHLKSASHRKKKKKSIFAQSHKATKPQRLTKK